MADDWADIASEALERWASGYGGGIDTYGIRLLLDLARQEPGLTGPEELTAPRLRRLMLETFPDTVVAEVEDMPSVMATAGAMVDFLAGTGRIEARRAAALHQELAALEPELTEIITELDEAERESAGEVVRGMMLADGVALDDEDAVGRWLADFESLSDDERFDRAAAYLREAEEMAVPPVVLAPPAELAAAARRSGLSGRVLALAGWADGRAVTELDEPLPADLPAAAAALDLPAPGAPGSLGDLPELARLWWAATEAGALAAAGGRAAPGPLLADLRDGGDEAVLAAWLRLFDEALVGAAGAVDEADTALLVRAELTGVLIHLYEQDEPAARQELAAALAEHLREAAEEHGAAPPSGDVAAALGRELDELASWGVVETVPGGGCALTPLGVWGVRELLLAEGFTAPVVGELTDRPAAALVAGLEGHGEHAFVPEVERWLAARPPETAAAELIEVMRSGGPGDRAIAAAVLAGADAAAEPVVREALADPAAGPYARLWLHEHGDRSAEPDAEDLAWMLADTVAAALESAEPAAAVAEVLADLPPDAGLTALIEAMGGGGHPQAAEVLDALGAHLPDPVPAGAARAEAARTRAVSGPPGSP
ncbi:hypothetical protein SAMN04489712_101170 [Thermomonospora echinospora]|uniref:Uncharacterized protein n=1 Tax=Thermomonospora echinospora TaxID=1992 RepID=A0A1H5SEE1_9ACTN|nr:hypothetical protein [Thermomonospora echinospora]SEF48790.1 hypothetical protein SAMN04489712_101170 [Thermomonospora echinospora]